MPKRDELIRDLAGLASGVRRLPAPSLRALAWLAAAIPYVVAVAAAEGFRPDLAEKFLDARFAVEQGAAFLTAIMAAFAAFCAVIPGRSQWLLLAPVPPLVVWLGSLGFGCLENWLRSGVEGLVLTPEWSCFPGIAMVGAFPAAAMAFMLRRGAPMYPRLGVALGGLAAAALGDFGLRLFHTTDASLMVLVWQLGSVALLTALAGLAGPWVHSWRRMPAGG